MFRVFLESSVEKDLRKLDPAIFKRIISALKELENNPVPHGCRKLVGSENDWRIRVGDWRIIYEIDRPGKVIRVMRIRHRREVYR
jgi:mRNA interferase RelE/StbE